jgi:cell division protein FtsI/penicillin-binding protein 2
MFCLSPATDRVDCPVPQKVQQTAIAMGWDSNCTSMSGEDSSAYGCGQIDSLWGKSAPVELGDVNQGLVQNSPSLYGWFMVKPVAETRVLRADFRFTVDKQRSTRGKEWYSQQTASVRDLSNDGLGQGESFVRPVGVAGMLANLVLAGNQQAQQPLPHLVRRLFDVNGKELELLKVTKPDMIPVTISPEIARQVLAMMQGNHKGTEADHGTGYTACAAVIGASACNRLTSVAGKTGTPTIKDAQNTQANLEKSGGCKKECYRPYKWYMAAYKSNPKLSYYDKVMVVLIERNWRKEGQLTGDEYNHAAEMAFRLMKGMNAVR